MLKDVLMKENKIPEFIKKITGILNEEKSIYLFGAGLGGKTFFSWAEENLVTGTRSIDGYIDNNPLKWGTFFPDMNSGVEVFEPEMFFQNYTNEMVVITCGEGDVISKQLQNKGIPADRILIPDITMLDLKNSDFEFIWNHIKEFESVYNMLDDDKSKKVFANILNYKICHDMRLIEEIADDYKLQYFDEELIKFSEKDVFVDCGSYVGDTVESYIEKNNNLFEKIICFEVDEENITVLEEKIKCFDENKIDIVKAAVWNNDEELMFNNLGSGSGFVSESGSKRITAKKIDSVIKGVPASHIKMDIEGAEFEALLGAYNTILAYKPVLQISVYHKKDDFIRIPLLIKSFYSGYKLYFRHYRENSVQETVCYAIPYKDGGLNGADNIK